MTRRVVAFGMVLACGAAWGSTYRFAALKQCVAHGDYTYRLVRRGRVKDFVLEAGFKTSAAGPAVRVVFGYQDERNLYYAEAADTGCGFVKVEDGIEKRIGTPSAGQLARDATGRLTVVRWRYAMGLWLDGRQVAEAYDGTFRSGRVGLGGRKDTVALDTVKFQVTGDVRLTDDFMRTDAEQNVWQTVAGSWKLKSLPNASMSANAFMFAGLGGADDAPGLAVRGNWFWHNYMVSAACRPLSASAAGLVFYYRSPTRYHLLRCVPLGHGGRVELVRVSGDRREVLAEAPAALAKGQWYRLSVRVVGQRATGLIDGNPLVDVTDPQLVSGSIGLYCEGAEGAVFDDVTVVAPRDFEDGFERATVGKWLELGGTWRRQPGRLDGSEGEGHCLVASAKGEGRCVSGEETWADYTVAADLLPPARGDAGLVAHYQDEANHYQFALSPDAATLVRVAEGVRTELARAAHPLPLGKVHRVELSVKNGVLTGRLDGRVLVRRCDRMLDRGRAGLLARDARGAGFDNVAVTFPRRAEPLFNAHGTFVAERSMKNWAVRQSDWLDVTESLGGGNRTVHWHRADFPGDVELEVRPDKLAEGGRLWLALAGDGKSAASGYLVCLDRGRGRCHVIVTRKGKPLVKHTLPLARAPQVFSAERVGHAILAHLDGKLALTCEDPQPLNGRHVGYAHAAAEVPPDGVNTFSRHVTVYSFNKAPADWRPVAGEWEVANRWACDPRWSFFAGERRDDTLVAMWNKRRFGPDVTLEFAAGIRHDPKRGGTGYRYASDINAVVCGDGADLRSGYTIVFAGWNNQFTRILRDGKPLAETRKFRFPRNHSQHHRWFYLKIQKQGDRVRLFVDNTLALECRDPQPLAGSQVALWTWNNDIMVARVRISARGDAPRELPVGPPPSQPHCCYR